MRNLSPKIPPAFRANTNDPPCPVTGVQLKGSPAEASDESGIFKYFLKKRSNKKCCCLRALCVLKTKPAGLNEASVGQEADNARNSKKTLSWALRVALKIAFPGDPFYFWFRLVQTDSYTEAHIHMCVHTFRFASGDILSARTGSSRSSL